MAATSDPLASLLDKLAGWLAQGRWTEARALETRLIARAGGEVRLWSGLAAAREAAGLRAAGLQARRRAVALAPDDPGAALGLAAALVDCGRWAEGAALAQALAQRDDLPAFDRLRLAAVLLEAARPDAALPLARQACVAAPDDADALYLLAACERQAGEIEAAREHVAEVLERAPDHADAVWMRSDLQRVTGERNNVSDLRRRLSRPLPRQLETRVQFALGKELEQLGDWPCAFAAVSRGAAVERAGLSYDVADDLRLIQTICARQTSFAAAGGGGAPAPIFVVGLPRTGTSLIERILDAHPQVRALGEPPAFDRALRDLAGERGARTESEVAAAAASIPPDALGRAYLALAGEANGPRLLDKRPANALHIPLIRAALPRARIVLVSRDLADAGWAMFKTLFNGAYPFSYDLDELGRYLKAHAAMTDQWCAQFAGDILEVRYEEVVANVEGQARRLLDFCDLPWDPVCVRFHEHRAPATSASAVQVRRPVYASSIGLWRRYADELRPMLAHLPPQ